MGAVMMRAAAVVALVMIGAVTSAQYPSECVWTDGETVQLDEFDAMAWRPDGAFTLGVVFTLTSEPREKKPLASRWETTDGGRSWEIGITDQGRPYLSISESGKYDAGAKELFGTRTLKADVPYTVVGAFEPNARMALRVNGWRAGELTSGVPGPLHASKAPAILGARPPGAMKIDAEFSRAEIWQRALSEKEIKRWTSDRSLTQWPGEEHVTFTEAVARHGGPMAKVRQITRGPKHHWFSYYDKMQVDASGRYALSMEVDFEGRSPTAEDVIGIGMVDLADGDRWIELGETRAWCWQQGCMLQWRPGHPDEALWNDREDGRIVTRVLSVKSRRVRTLPHAIYHVHPEGKLALGVDFARVNHMRPGYGYGGVDDVNRDVLAPDDSGLYLLDLDTGERTELFSIADIAKIPYANPKPGDKHYFNHIQWSPNGERFLFLHRWRPGEGRGFQTRMLTAAADGTDIRLVTDKPGVSHFTWRDPEHILIHRGAYRLYRDDGSGDEETIWEAPNGHQTYLPGNEWLMTDTYPTGKAREQILYLLHIPTQRVRVLGRFAQPKEYAGEWRCDLHPRVGHDGSYAIIDSTHGGEGRQLYLVETARAR